MKKIIMILLLVCFFAFPVYGEDGEEAIILPNGESASDDFADGVNGGIWVYHNTGSLLQKIDGVVAYSSDENVYIHQPFDYNSGILRSNYYRFEVEIAESERNYYNYRTGGFMLVEDPSYVYAGTTVASRLSPGWFQHYTGYSHNWMRYEHGYYNVIKYVNELYRIGDENMFNVVQTTYKNGEEIARYERYAELETMYPVVFATQGVKGKFRNFSAYYIPQALDTVEWTQMYQEGDKLNLSWALDTEKYDHVKIIYGSDENLDFDTDQVIYSGLSSSSTKELPLPSTENFYIGIKGYGQKETEENIVLFEPVSDVENFEYQYTNTENSYTFTWTKNDDVMGYYFYDGATLRTLSKEKTSITLYDVSNPEGSYIASYKASPVGGTYSEGHRVNPILSDIGTVENLTYNQVNYDVDLSWDALPGAESYIVYRDFGDNSFVTLTSQLEINSYETSTNNQNVMTRYMVKGVKGDLISQGSNIIEVANKVKGLSGELVDRVELEWQAIGDATSYTIYVSESQDMSDVDTFTSNTNSYAYEAAAGDVVDKYFQVEAVKDVYSSQKSDVTQVDMSANRKVENLIATSNQSLNVVDLTWDELSEAVEYKVYQGSTLLATVTDESYRYVVLEDDPDYMDFTISGVGPLFEFVPSDPAGAYTFSNGFVKNLKAVKDPNLDIIHLTWDAYYRADDYTIVVGNDDVLTDSESFSSSTNAYDYIIDGDDGLIKYFKVRANMATVHSGYSSVVSSEANDAIDIEVSEGNGISGQYYDEPIETSLVMKVNEERIYNPVIEIDLNNVLYPSDSQAVASFIYPEIGTVSITGYSGELDYLVQIKSLSASGYKVQVYFTTPNMESILTQGRSIVVPLKTGINFSQVSGSRSILYKSDTTMMTWMDLPFSIEEQIAALNSRVSFENGGLEGNLVVQATLKYDLNPGDKTSTSIIPIEYINRLKIPIQN